MIIIDKFIGKGIVQWDEPEIIDTGIGGQDYRDERMSAEGNIWESRDFIRVSHESKVTFHIPKHAVVKMFTYKDRNDLESLAMHAQLEELSGE